MELGDSSAASGLLALFCARLKRLQAASGISQASLASVTHLGSSQMSDILNGRIKRLPAWDVTIAMIRACLRYAEAKGGLVPPDLRDEEDWRRRYSDLDHDLDAQARAKPRREILPRRLLAEVTDPFALEVHRPVQPDHPERGLPALPVYLPREHDAALAQVVAAAAQGTSEIAVLVGGSSTGKTRACWEALALLRGHPKPWRLWHPIDPTRPDAALRELPSIGSRTVVWLNEAQFYLDVVTGGLGERIAAGLRELLRDPARAPVLVLATLWPQYWNTLTARPAAGADPHAQARELLAGQDISVPAAFTADQLQQLPGAGDPRLAQAARAAENGQVIQFLAGAPELMARYRHAPPAASALIDAAIDARRLGMGIALPLAFLEAAALGYLTDAEWDEFGEDWLEQALAYTAAPCNGIRGPLTRIRPRTGSVREPTYRLADYLEQHGRRSRRLMIPPAEFWDSAARFANRVDVSALARAAEKYGLLRDAFRLRKRAAEEDPAEAVALVRHWYFRHPHKADPNPARWAVAHAPTSDPFACARLLDALRVVGGKQSVTDLASRAASNTVLDDAVGVALLLEALQAVSAGEQVAVVVERGPATHAALDDPLGVGWLLDLLREMGAGEQVGAMLARGPAAHAALDDPVRVAKLLGALRRAGAKEQSVKLATRAVAHTPLDNPHAVTRLLDVLREVRVEEQGIDLAARAAARVALDDPARVATLLRAMRMVGAGEKVAAVLARDPAAHADLSDPVGVARLLDELRQVGAREQVEVGAREQVAVLLARDPASHAVLDNSNAVVVLMGSLRKAGAEQKAVDLATRAAKHTALGDPYAVARILRVLQEVGADEQVAAVIARDPALHSALENPAAVAELLDALREVGADEQAVDLAIRAAAEAALDDPAAVAWLLGALQNMGADEQVAVMLARDPAACVALDDPAGICWLLGVLREVGADVQVTDLATRAAAHAVLDRSASVARLLGVLREAGAEQQARTLVDRLPAEGWFDLFSEQPGNETRYRFGRELDGSPAPSWSWDDLDRPSDT